MLNLELTDYDAHKKQKIGDRDVIQASFFNDAVDMFDSKIDEKKMYWI